MGHPNSKVSSYSIRREYVELLDEAVDEIGAASVGEILMAIALNKARAVEALKPMVLEARALRRRTRRGEKEPSGA